jgi:hypothetical protein
VRLINRSRFVLNSIKKIIIGIGIGSQEVALRNRQNIWIDGTLRDVDWYSKVFDSIRERYPHYAIGIFQVFASEGEAGLSRLS